jgi:hypothetical protein
MRVGVAVPRQIFFGFVSGTLDVLEASAEGEAPIFVGSSGIHTDSVSVAHPSSVATWASSPVADNTYYGATVALGCDVLLACDLSERKAFCFALVAF